MIRHLVAFVALAFLSACAVTNTATFSGEFEPPPANSRVLVMTPNVQLHVLTAAGMPEPREDWSIAGRDNLAATVATFVQTEAHTPSALDPSTAMEGRVGQIIRLHDAVGESLVSRGFLPTQRDRFEWTLGEGVRELGAAHNADYALFIGAYGTYASAGRVAMMVGMSLLGVGIPLGNQVAYASLVDLRTGNIIWFNTVVAAPNQDMRDPDGAAALTESLMKDAPL
ncbi:MAG: hypothetical protein K2P58_00470 [Hyphomonadaceae bacterium]|nr:hypothetical protein [Hyphomonadaceae bacterium]